jgi:hypothetical protein
VWDLYTTMGTSTLDGVDDEISTPVIPSIFVRMEDFDTLQVKHNEKMNATSTDI